MKKEAVVYLYLGILIFGAILAIYFFNLQLTGFAVYQQQSNFSLGEKNNVEYNGTVLTLISNQTAGNYTSQFFDSNNDSTTWTNLTIQGTGNLTFEIRVCSSSDCSNDTFASADLNNINKSGRYFQYRALFYNNDSNSTIYLESAFPYHSLPDSSLVIPTSVLISEPTGIKPSGSGIPLQYTFTGENPSCWYNIYYTADNILVTGNTTIPNCGNISLDLGTGDEIYVLNIYVNDSSGLVSDSSDFSIVKPSPIPRIQTEAEEAESTTQVSVQTTPEVTEVTELSLQAIETSTMNPSSSSNLNLIAKNIGNVPLSACELSAGGDFVSWLSVPENSQNLNAEEEKSFAFSVTIPENAEENSYLISLSVQCSEILKNSEFSVNVAKERIKFNVTGVERTRANRVVVTYSLDELLDEEQTVQLQFFLYDAGNKEVGNASTNQTLSAGESNDFRTNIAINGSLYNENTTLTLTANLNSQKYSVSVKKEPIKLGTPTGFFALGDNLGTTGNVLAIVILIAGIAAVFFFMKRRKVSKKMNA